MRAQRPILGLTDPAGDTASVLRNAEVDTLVPLDSADAIESFLPRFLDQILAGSAPLPTPLSVRAASRYGRTKSLADLLEMLPPTCEGA